MHSPKPKNKLCRRCSILQLTCYCAAIPEQPICIRELGFRVFLYVKEREIEQAFRTGHLCRLLFGNSVTTGFTVADAAIDPDLTDVTVLWTRPDSECVTDVVEDLCADNKRDKLIIAIDGTWNDAKTLYRNIVVTTKGNHRIVCLPPLSRLTAWDSHLEKKNFQTDTVAAATDEVLKLFFGSEFSDDTPIQESKAVDTEVNFPIQELQGALASTPGSCLGKLRAEAKISRDVQHISTVEAVAAVLEIAARNRRPDLYVDPANNALMVQAIHSAFQRRQREVWHSATLMRCKVRQSMPDDERDPKEWEQRWDVCRKLECRKSDFAGYATMFAAGVIHGQISGQYARRSSC